jgi:hypothetical protein
MVMKQLKVDMAALKASRKKFLKLGEELEKAEFSGNDRANLTHTFYKLGRFLTVALPEWRNPECAKRDSWCSQVSDEK